MSNKANIIYWNQEYRNDFIRLNREWIERYFRSNAKSPQRGFTAE